MEYKLVVVGAGGVGEYDLIWIFMFIWHRTIFMYDVLDSHTFRNYSSVYAPNDHFCNIIVAYFIFHFQFSTVVQCTVMQLLCTLTLTLTLMQLDPHNTQALTECSVNSWRWFTSMHLIDLLPYPNVYRNCFILVLILIVCLIHLHRVFISISLFRLCLIFRQIRSHNTINSKSFRWRIWSDGKCSSILLPFFVENECHCIANRTFCTESKWIYKKNFFIFRCLWCHQ